MIEVKLTEQELDYIKLKLEEVLDDGKNYMNKSIIEDLYSKLVCLNFNKLMGVKKDKLEVYEVLIDGLEREFKNSPKSVQDYMANNWKECMEDLVRDFDDNIFNKYSNNV
mgnify:CR=1 FL=1|tara:strand:+ start:1253 stop:1582 length:330 start_codon:yes stop_codon:yes gene_type:complete